MSPEMVLNAATIEKKTKENLLNIGKNIESLWHMNQELNLLFPCLP